MVILPLPKFAGVTPSATLLVPDPHLTRLRTALNRLLSPQDHDGNSKVFDDASVELYTRLGAVTYCYKQRLI